MFQTATPSTEKAKSSSTYRNNVTRTVQQNHKENRSPGADLRGFFAAVVVGCPLPRPIHPKRTLPFLPPPPLAKNETAIFFSEPNGLSVVPP